MSLTKLPLRLLGLIIAGAVLYLLLAPVPITPAAWTPPNAPTLTGNYEQNSRLSSVQRLALGEGHGPEDVALDSESRIYAGFDDGRIVRLEPDGTRPQAFANTQGRPLGLKFDRSGNLIVADAIKGLLAINRAGQIATLAEESDGAKFGCLNDVDVAADGTIYFTEASHKFPMSQFTEDLLEHRPNGRLMAFDPGTRKTRTLLKDLYFANGVAVSPNQTFLLVAETGKYRLRKFWLSGAQKGRAEIFIENLPGFPDGVSSNGKDKFWLALVTPRDEFFDKILPYPFVRKMVLRLPKFLRPAPKRYSFVLGFDTSGRIVDNLQNGGEACYAQIANVVERNGALYFGSIAESTVGKFALR